MINVQLLKDIIEKHDHTQAALAKALGLSPSRLSAKINEHNTEFTLGEILFIRDRYHLTNTQLVEIFFAE